MVSVAAAAGRTGQGRDQLQRYSSSSDREHRPARKARQQPAQIVVTNRDAALGRRKSWSRAMKKNGAAAPPSPRRKIIIEHDHDVVEVIVAPQIFVRSPERRHNRAIIHRAVRVIAPAFALSNWSHWQARRLRYKSVRTVKTRKKTPASCRTRMIALALVAFDAGGSDSAKHNERSRVQPSDFLSGNACHDQTIKVKLAVTLALRGCIWRPR